MFLNAGFANSMGNMRVFFVTNRFSPDQVEAQIKYTLHGAKKGARPMFATGKMKPEAINPSEI